MAVQFYRSRKTKAYHWRVRGRNGRILADSGEGYRRKADCAKGLLLVSTQLVRYVLGLKAAGRF